MMLTKSDYLKYLDSPIHLWAKKHDRLDNHEESLFLQHLFTEGYKVDSLGKEYLEKYVMPKFSKAKLSWQHTYEDKDFLARSDGIIFDEETNAYHIYEIKSGTRVKLENLYDATFQTLVCEAYIPIGSVSIVYINTDYVREGELDLEQLFVVEDVTEKVMELRAEVLSSRREALKVVELKSFDSLPACNKPKKCPCLAICHPGLPDYSIYELMALGKKQMDDLLAMKVLEMANIPDDFELKGFQCRQVTAVKNNKVEMLKGEMKRELEKLVFPLWFLDYESYLSAIPLWDRCSPQRQYVFQYSLHKLDKVGGRLEHFEHLYTGQDEPSKNALEHLVKDLGEIGSVVVWNKGFEMTMNMQMATMYPEYTEYLNRVNSRVFDLMEIFRQGLYVHPDFHGSYSIKNVLPIMVPELTYKGMDICKGDDAMVAWWNLTHGEKTGDSVASSLLKYCELDTLAMVEIYKKLVEI